MENIFFYLGSEIFAEWLPIGESTEIYANVNKMDRKNAYIFSVPLLIWLENTFVDVVIPTDIKRCLILAGRHFFVESREKKPF